MRSGPPNHHRRSIRLQGYDYSQAGAYFITICTHERVPHLGTVRDDVMQISVCGQIAQQCWNNLPHHFPHITLDSFVVMPNHLHGIIVMADDGEGEAFLGAGPTSIGDQSKVSCQSRREAHECFSPTDPPRGTVSGSLSAIVQNYKSISARRINQYRRTPGMRFWQRNYHEHIIRNNVEWNQIRQYVQQNPIRWEDDIYHA